MNRAGMDLAGDAPCGAHAVQVEATGLAELRGRDSLPLGAVSIGAVSVERAQAGAVPAGE